MNRIAVINRFASEYTTATYFLEALQEIGVPYTIFHPDQQKNIPPAYTIRLYIDDGSHYCIYPVQNILNVLYIIDTHTRFDLDAYLCRFADIVFCAQYNAIAMIQPLCKNVFWLPHACSQRWNFSAGCEKKYDIAFIGDINNDPKRERYLHVLRKRFGDACFIGRAKKEDIGKIYSSAKIVFNVSYNNDINMRFFEALCSGAMLLTEKITDNGMSELLHGENEPICAFYESFEEAIALIDFYLTHEEERQNIALRGKVFSNTHTYTQRVKTILETAEALSSTEHSRLAYYWHTAQLRLREDGIKNLARQCLGRTKRAILG